jgi:hypothetical protein
MIKSHLDSYEIALIAWVLLFAVVGIQGFLSMFIEGDTESPGHAKKKRAPILIVDLMIVIVGIDIYLAWSFVQQLYGPASPHILAQIASLMAFSLAALFTLYRRYFIDDVVISQERDDEIPW